MARLGALSGEPLLPSTLFQGGCLFLDCILLHMQQVVTHHALLQLCSFFFFFLSFLVFPPHFSISVSLFFISSPFFFLVCTSLLVSSDTITLQIIQISLQLCVYLQLYKQIAHTIFSISHVFLKSDPFFQVRVSNIMKHFLDMFIVSVTKVLNVTVMEWTCYSCLEVLLPPSGNGAQCLLFFLQRKLSTGSSVRW